jgi:hypothetical protein
LGEGIAMRKVALIVAMVVLLTWGKFTDKACGTEKEPLAFKDYILGTTTLERVKQINLGIACRTGDGVSSDDECYATSETIAGVNCKWIHFFFYDGKLESIMMIISHDKFDEVVSVLKEQYGSPTGGKPVVLQEPTGATLRGKQLEWRLVGGEIRVIEYVNRGDESAINYATYKSSEEFKRREHQRDKRGSKDH